MSCTALEMRCDAQNDIQMQVGTAADDVSRQIKADLVTSFGKQFLPAEWADATGQQVAAPGLPAGSLTVSDGAGPACVLLPPRAAPACLNMDELAKMRAVLQQEHAVEILDKVKARKRFRAKLASGKIAGSKRVGSDSDKHRRRNYLVRINSSEKFFLPDSSLGEHPVSTFGAVRHYAVVFIDRRAMAFAYVERTWSTKDLLGRYGYAAVRLGNKCFLGLGGVPYYVPVGAIHEVVGTLEREGMHFVLHTPEPFFDCY